MKRGKTLRVVQAVFIIYAIGIDLLILRAPSRALHPPAAGFQWAIVVYALISIAAGIYLPKVLAHGPRRPDSVPQNTPAQRWFIGNLLRMAFTLAASLFAVSLHFAGSPQRVTLPLAGLALLLLLCLRPGAEPQDDPACEALCAPRLGAE